MKNFVIAFSILFSGLATANMAEPIDRGTFSSRPFLHQYVDVVKEELKITIDENFETAQFDVVYHVNALKSGVSIPFLFYAYNFKEDFEIYVRNEKLSLIEVPDEYKVPEGTIFNDFDYFFEARKWDDTKSVLIDESDQSGFYVRLNDMLYFEADIDSGYQVFKASYKANVWRYFSGWVNQYTFRYALSPAKYWRSFGELELTLDASRWHKPINSNLEPPDQGDINEIAVWKFDSIPVDIIHFNYDPEISEWAKWLIKTGPYNLAVGMFILLGVIHLFLTTLYRVKRTKNKISAITIVGGIVVPLIFVISWYSLYGYIDNQIGEEATRMHHYSIFVLIFFPVYMVPYLCGFILYDFILKRIILKRRKELF